MREFNLIKYQKNNETKESKFNEILRKKKKVRPNKNTEKTNAKSNHQIQIEFLDDLQIKNFQTF